MSVEDVLKIVKEKEVKFIDYRFTNTHGKEQHVTVTANEDGIKTDFTEGKMFDGSSIAGWKNINESDMILMPDPSTAVMDPFFDEPTLVVSCDIIEPEDGKPYEKDPRSIAKKAEAYLRDSGIADTAYFGPENEFFVFDDVKFEDKLGSSSFSIDSTEACYNSGKNYEEGNMGHRPLVKGGYFPVPPVDALQDCRSAMITTCEEMGVPCEVHHHEVATAGQCEIGTVFNTLVAKADEVQKFKYVVMNVAHAYGKTATFMPKPLVGDNGSGMHVHMSLSKDGKNIFAGDKYGKMSDEALYYIGGIIKHARALNAFTNASTNGYKRLIPGFEAPVILTYSARNRSAAIRIPYVMSDKARRIEVRFPDSTANPYLAFSALMMAGLDGIKNKVSPGEAMDQDLFELTVEEEKMLPTVAPGLDVALDALDKDRDFLKEGGVFTDKMIDSYIGLKYEEVQRLRASTHPCEFEMYYSL
ncbi:MAG: type I glutamate--ammonia ligase [Gammaproteobacteria bacterium]|nr:type I glutamate--ammonia ligase [Gammaproteobacteria bacterium]MBT4462359.1 type I glutamate--ammonia ligase [Gammaproteobacteria bacterium]MBT4655286.1 type I glutamate--ammonia ligase [Gammaproteobacteria bacterium]MBT5117212.1 type I glutamate--ammonia ligase [Gammaproteobacteria bacterium]MBT5762101.1 type I glutamate--ammonia ligase [Gammaproteobacteria bacterium]